MVILVFPCFPMFFTFSLLLYINWQWIDVSTIHRQVHFEKMLVGNSRNFPFCILQDPFLDYMANIYDYYISISWEYYISFLHYHIYIYPIISIPFWRNISVAPPGSVGELQLAIATPEAPAELQAPWPRPSPWPWPPWSRIPRGIWWYIWLIVVNSG